MTSDIRTRRKPPITFGQSDYEQLMRLADSGAGKPVFDDLLTELERGRVTPDARLADTIVRMGTTLRYSTDAGEDRTVTLVFPHDADISAGKISILTPIGVALIGLSAGQSIDWEARDGRIRRLTVESVDAGKADTTLLRAS